MVPVSNIILSLVVEHRKSLFLQKLCQIISNPHHRGPGITIGRIFVPLLGMGVVDQNLGTVHIRINRHIGIQQLFYIQLVPSDGCCIVDLIKGLPQIIKILQLLPVNGDAFFIFAF